MSPIRLPGPAEQQGECMRKILGKFHTWLGLLCAPYIIVFGFSALHFNHHFSFVDSGESTVNWEMDITATDTSDDGALAQRVRDAMDLPGWIPWWRYERGEDNTFTFSVNRPGKEYRITADPRRTHASVAELRHGVFRVANSLHEPGIVPGMPLTRFWRFYAVLTVLFVLYAGGSGVYFWAKRKDEKLIGKILLLGITGGSILFMIFVRIWG
jgi:hypothetical protein